MGQKINPFLFRFVLNKDWNSIWYASKNDFSDYLMEDIKIRKTIETNLKNIICANILIKKTKFCCNIYLYIVRKNFLKKLYNEFSLKIKKELSLITDKEIFIKIINIKRKDVNPSLIFLDLKDKVTLKKSYKNHIKFIMQKAIKSGAIGIKIFIKGRVNGSSMSKKQVFKEGSIPLQEMIASVSYHSGAVKTSYGLIGIKVWVYLGKYIYIKNATT